LLLHHTHPPPLTSTLSLHDALPILLDETSMKGAKGLLISITGGRDMTLFEVDEAATRIREEVDPDANIILGATFDEDLEGVIRVSVVATGIDKAAADIAAAPTVIRATPRPAAQMQQPKPAVQVAQQPQAPAAPVRPAASQPGQSEASLIDQQIEEVARSVQPVHQPAAPAFQPQSNLFRPV